MNGAYRVQLKSNRISYDFEVKRKITMIRGDSGTGKTTMMNLLTQALGRVAGFQLICDVACAIVPLGDDWRSIVLSNSNRIYFIDETHNCFNDPKFAGTIKESDNYFVLICRDDYDSIPYSVNEIYEIKNSGKFNRLIPVFVQNEEAFSPTYIITEDSGAGYQFFNKSTNIHVDSAEGKSKIYSKVVTLPMNERLLIVIDGAAFGSNLSDLLELLERRFMHYCIFAPESFEFLLLSSPMFDFWFTGNTRLSNPEEYVRPKHFSWEQYFTDLLVEITRNLPCSYHKDRLNRCFSENCCCKDTHCDCFIADNKMKAILYRFGSHLNLWEAESQDKLSLDSNSEIHINAASFNNETVTKMDKF